MLRFYIDTLLLLRYPESCSMIFKSRRKEEVGNQQPSKSRRRRNILSSSSEASSTIFSLPSSTTTTTIAGRMMMLLLLLVITVPAVVKAYVVTVVPTTTFRTSQQQQQRRHHAVGRTATFGGVASCRRSRGASTPPFVLLAKATTNNNDDNEEEMFFMNQNDDDDDDDGPLEEELLLVDDDDDELLLEDDDDDDDDDEYDEEVVGEYEEEDDVSDSDLYEDDDDDDDDDYELVDDGSDPNYTKQLELVEASIQARRQQADDQAFDPVEFMLNDNLSDSDIQALNESPLSKQVQDIVQNMQLAKDDIDWDNLEKDVENIDNVEDDPYPTHEPGEENLLEQDIGITDADMVELQDAWKMTQDAQTMEPWDRVVWKNEMSDAWDQLSNETLEEIDDCLEEIGGSAYNVTRWLLYDLDFNVTNLMLAAIKHNEKAPILFQHWYPQLLTYGRYKFARDRNFDFTWADVKNADLSELERYYAGFGYDEIPTKLPGETGIISLEDLDEEEIKMAAFESWMTEVYNPEWDRKDFDDDELRDEDNVFSKYFEPPQHPDLPVYEDIQQDLAEWDQEIGEEEKDKEYKEFMGRDFQYEVIEDEEFEREFRGHLVVACTGADADLEVAEKITARMAKEFGKKIFVETRVYAHALDIDNVFEIWLESYDIDLLHSKKRASMNTKGWDGPVECDDKQIDWLVEKVGFLISDDARYSYRYEMAEAD